MFLKSSEGSGSVVTLNNHQTALQHNKTTSSPVPVWRHRNHLDFFFAPHVLFMSSKTRVMSSVAREIIYWNKMRGQLLCYKNKICLVLSSNLSVLFIHLLFLLLLLSLFVFSFLVSAAIKVFIYLLQQQFSLLGSQELTGLVLLCWSCKSAGILNELNRKITTLTAAAHLGRVNW